MTEAQRERLILIAEEANEVSQAVMKILRFGFEQNKGYEGPTGKDRLETELGDFLRVLRLAIDSGDLSEQAISRSYLQKLEKMRPFLFHQDLPEREETLWTS